MPKKLTTTLNEEDYANLLKVVGSRNISCFIEGLIRPYLIDRKLEAAYQAMANDEQGEVEALECAEATVGDVA